MPVSWNRACRIVPTRYPSIFLFDRVADAGDFDALYALEALTNARVRDEIGTLERVAPSERIFGAGSGPIMAAFTHVNEEGRRFSDGSYGMFYAASDRATAIAETRHHHARFLSNGGVGAMHVPMRLYQVRVHADLHDLRPAGAVEPAVYDPESYAASRVLAAALRRAGSLGLVYRSVRHPDGACAGLFTPRAASRCVHAAFLVFAWDGARFTDVYEKID